MECRIHTALEVNKVLDERTQKTSLPKMFGAHPERAIIIGRTDGADTALYHLEQRPMGGVVLIDFKNRGSFLWAIIRKHAGPRGGNLAFVNAEPPKGSRFADRYSAKLGVEILPIEKLVWAAKATIRGVDGKEPKKVRVLGLTLGMTSGVYKNWQKTLPRTVTMTPTCTSPSSKTSCIPALGSSTAGGVLPKPRQ